MNKSENIATIAKALAAAQSEMGSAVKDAKNPFFKSSYADLNAIREAVLPVLNRHKISVLQPTTVIEGNPFVETVLLHESGEFISSVTEVIASKANDAQSHGSGISYARRYGLQSLVCVGAEDDDGNAATGKTTATVSSKNNNNTTTSHKVEVESKPAAVKAGGFGVKKKTEVIASNVEKQQDGWE